LPGDRWSQVQFFERVFAMAKLKLEHLRAGLVADFRAIIAAWNIGNLVADLGRSEAFKLLRKVCEDRAYDDSHPMHKHNPLGRVLPYDGRVYCFYYVDGADDSHVWSLLRAVLADLKKTDK
jgi:hypothetical protein